LAPSRFEVAAPVHAAGEHPLSELVARARRSVHALEQKSWPPSAACARPARGRAKAFCPPQWGAIPREMPSSASGLAGIGRGRIFPGRRARRGTISTGGKELGEKYFNRVANWPGSEQLFI